MSSSHTNVASEFDKRQSSTQTSSPISLPTTNTITQFQIINPESSASYQEKQFPARPSRYHIDYAELFKDKIDPLHRFKLIKWLQSQVFRQKYYRDVFAYAIYYFDSYLQKSEKIQLKDLQTTALAALLIATKIDGATFPKLGSKFGINEILEVEIKICLRLNYFLYPKTYVHILNQYIENWDKYIASENLYEKEDQYLQQSLTSFQRCRSLFQKMQCLVMAPQSYKFNLNILALNLFYLENKISMEKINIKSFNHQNLVFFVRDSYEKFDNYGFIFQQFIQSCSKQLQLPLDSEIGTYLTSFIKIPISSQTPNCRCLNYQSFLRMQTVSEEAVKFMDKFVKKAV